MISNKIPRIFQSAYLPQKFTETALTLISSNLLSKLESTIQGSVLGHILFNIYLLVIFENFNKYPAINFHSYADDLQIHLKHTDSPYCILRQNLNFISDLLKMVK